MKKATYNPMRVAIHSIAACYLCEWSIAVVERAKKVNHDIQDDLDAPALTKKQGTNRGKSLG